MSEYLKPKQHYIDLYDRLTVEKCRNAEKLFDQTKVFEKDKKTSLAEQKRFMSASKRMYVYFVSGERYKQKEETIRKWMDSDEERDRRVNSVPTPEASCPSCGNEMECISKDLRDENNRERILFTFSCKECSQHRGIYDDGEEYVVSVKHCPKCNEVLVEGHSRKEKKITTVYNCPSCGYTDKEFFDLYREKDDKKSDPNFERDKKRFCLSDKEGQEYISQTEQIIAFQKEVEKKEKNKEVLKRVSKLNKLTIVELQKLLLSKLESEKYINLQLAAPDVTDKVIVPFTLQDAKKGRDERTSEYELRRLLKRTLENTNWRLMSDGISYRLGILSGRLRGYESEKDLMNLVN